VPCGPVNGLRAATQEPQLLSRGMFVETAREPGWRTPGEVYRGAGGGGAEGEGAGGAEAEGAGGAGAEGTGTAELPLKLIASPVNLSTHAKRKPWMVGRDAHGEGLREALRSKI
jgi:hypothetical protein